MIIFVCHRQVDDGQHHEDEGLQGDDQDVEHSPRPLQNHAQAATVFPILSVYHTQGVRIEDLVVMRADGGYENLTPREQEIFALLAEGHSLKHILAAVAAFWLARMLRRRSPVRA